MSLWQTYREWLGCPLYQARRLIQDAEQAFVNGHMFWRADNDWAYVAYEEGGFIFRDSDGLTKGLAYVFLNDNTFARVPY